MGSWWQHEVVAAGRLPLGLCFLAFVVTFVSTRTITRLIRDGRGPFRNNVTASGTHVPAMTRIAGDYGYTLAELRKL
jgi:hypothetical protein